jgi:hypothetical protein
MIPVVGDITMKRRYIVWEARNLGMPKWKLLRMAGNVAFDSAVGATVPLAGDLFDFLFRSNSRNLPDYPQAFGQTPETQIIEDKRRLSINWADEVQRLDAADPSAHWRDAFQFPSDDPGLSDDVLSAQAHRRTECNQ